MGTCSKTNESGTRDSGNGNSWGLFDTEDKVWLGDDNGPLLFDEEILARVAAELSDVMIGQEPGRTAAKVFDGGALRLRDHRSIRMSAEAALAGLEEGRF
jgi:hypothetical protein